MYKYGDFRYCVFSMKCTGLLYYVLGVSACRTGVIFLRILGEQRRKGGEREAWVMRKGKSAKKNNVCTHTIVQAVLAFKYECGYPISYLTSRDPRTFFKYNMAVASQK